jgi:D-sedoheptulose 7-phosphate isomerase
MTVPSRVADPLDEHIELAGRMRELLPQVEAIAAAIVRVYEGGGRLYTFGNGGSAADAQHLSGELLGRFKRERRPLAAQALSADPSTVTCIANDYSFDDLFARQLEALAGPGDIAIGYTTSGRSENVVRGLRTARERGAVTVLFGGGGPARDQADHALVVPSQSTARTQEMHLLLMHLIIERVDAWAAS